MENKLFWKVKYGFNASEYVSVDQLGLQKAIYAQVKRKPVQLADAYIDGGRIISITPHYHKYTGWNEWYEPKEPEDWKQIQRDCPNFDGVIENVKNHVADLMMKKQDNLIGKTELPIMIAETNPVSEMTKALAEKMKLKE